MSGQLCAGGERAGSDGSETFRSPLSHDSSRTIFPIFRSGEPSCGSAFLAVSRIAPPTSRGVVRRSLSISSAPARSDALSSLKSPYPKESILSRTSSSRARRAQSATSPRSANATAPRAASGSISASGLDDARHAIGGSGKTSSRPLRSIMVYPPSSASSSSHWSAEELASSSLR
jgi:hypothetical protein